RRDVALPLEDMANEIGASEPAGRQIGLAVDIAVAIGAAVAGIGRDVLGAGEKRPDPVRAEDVLAADAAGAEAGAMERVPERDRLESSGGEPGELQRDLDRIRAAGGEQHLAELARRDRGKLACQGDRRLVGEAARREREIVELRLDGSDEARMPIADMVHAVAVKI